PLVLVRNDARRYRPPGRQRRLVADLERHRSGSMPGRAKAARAQPRSASKRDRVRALCEALPHTERMVQGDHDTYRVRGKVFAYFLDDHHGDGIVSVCVKSELGENVDRARLAPERFYLPDYIGPR